MRMTLFALARGNACTLARTIAGPALARSGYLPLTGSIAVANHWLVLRTRHTW